MKTVFFLRHGKSDWGATFGGDHERPLAKRGRNAAKRVGAFLAETDQIPDEIVSSTAVRARTTVRLASEAGDWNVPISETDALYGADPQTLLDFIHEAALTSESLLLVGHEPGWSMTVGSLIGQASVIFPTACLARIDFGVASWDEVAFGQGSLIFLLPPRLLPDYNAST